MSGFHFEFSKTKTKITTFARDAAEHANMDEESAAILTGAGVHNYRGQNNEEM